MKIKHIVLCLAGTFMFMGCSKDLPTNIPAMGSGNKDVVGFEKSADADTLVPVLISGTLEQAEINTPPQPVNPRIAKSLADFPYWSNLNVNPQIAMQDIAVGYHNGIYSYPFIWACGTARF